MNTIDSNIDTMLSNVLKIDEQNDGQTLKQFQEQLVQNSTQNDKNISKEDEQLQKNLKLATMFSSDPYMSMVLVEAVKNGDTDSSTKLLTDLFTQRNIYLDTQNDSTLRGSLLRQSIIDQIDDEDIKQEQQKIEDQFRQTMLQFDISEYFNSMLDFGRDEKDKHKNDSLGSLYTNFYAQNELLYNNYKDLKNMNDVMLSQYTNNLGLFL